MEHSLTLWVVFNLFIIVMLLVDLLVFNRKPHEITIRESLIWTGIWVAFAMFFGGGLYLFMDPQSSLDYFTGYLIEKSLSIDNIFVFLLIFNYFKVPARYQHKVLFWGILGALVFRLLFIFAGVILIERFHWIIYIFGAFLIYTGIKLGLEKDKEIRPEKNPLLILTRRFIPISRNYHGEQFFTRLRGRLVATPMFIVLIVIETTDIVFALDSIPAIMAITRDTFIIYSANAFAILGLRALYFALSGVMKLFHYLHYGLAFILVYIGFKMVLEPLLHVPTQITLLLIICTLTVSVVFSIFYPKKHSETVPGSDPLNNTDSESLHTNGSEPYSGDRVSAADESDPEWRNGKNQKGNVPKRTDKQSGSSPDQKNNT